MTTPNDLDFSISNTPDEWLEATPDQEHTAPRRPRADRANGPTPKHDRPDLFSGTFMGLAAALAVGVGWFYYEARELGIVWWLPIAAATVLAIAIRVGAGSASPGLRACLATGIYSFTVVVTGLMIARSGLISQDAEVTLQTVESRLTFDQFTRTRSFLGLAGGILAIVFLSYGTRTKSQH